MRQFVLSIEFSLFNEHVQVHVTTVTIKRGNRIIYFYWCTAMLCFYANRQVKQLSLSSYVLLLLCEMAVIRNAILFLVVQFILSLRSFAHFHCVGWWLLSFRANNFLIIATMIDVIMFIVCVRRTRSLCGVAVSSSSSSSLSTSLITFYTLNGWRVQGFRSYFVLNVTKE